jgi:uncharacterized membrane protein
MTAPTPQAGKQARGVTLERKLADAVSNAQSLGDLIGGRVLAWLGGAAMLLGIVLFLGLAVSHGWVDQRARVLLAGTVSAALMGAGVWLHARRGGTRAASAMVGAATAALFATLIVASDVYRLLPSTLALVGALLVGTLASVLAIRWAGRAVGGLGLLGALMAGVMVGARIDALTIAILALSAASAMWVVVWQRWGWLALGTVSISAPQWVIWLAEGQSASVDALVLAAFAALGLIGAVGLQLRCREQRLMRTAAAVALLSAGIVALVGRIALADAASPAVGDLWLAALAGAHVAVGIWGARGARVPGATEARVPGARDARVPGAADARVPARLRGLLIAIGVTLADVAFALSAHGTLLVLGWSAVAVAFAWLAGRSVRQRHGAGLQLAGVAAHLALVLVCVIAQAPPSKLVGGHVQLLALLSVAALAVSCVVCGRLLAPAGSAQRQWWSIGAGTAVLYLVSLVTVAAFQSTSTTVSAEVLELSVHQQGQVALSALWSLVGLAALVAGLRTNIAPLRTAGLALLLVAVGKVFLFDLSTLTSVYRVASFIVLGLLLLVGAFAHQRLRPSPLPDMRSLHHCER